MWGVTHTHTTPYHPQVAGVVERGLRDALRAPTITRPQDEWDRMLPCILQTFRGMPHSTMRETPNFMMLGRKVQLPDNLQHNPRQAKNETKEAEKGEDVAPLRFGEGDLMLMENRCRQKRESSKLQLPFCGPYTVVKAYRTTHIMSPTPTNLGTKRRTFERMPSRHGGRTGPGHQRSLPKTKHEGCCQANSEVDFAAPTYTARATGYGVLFRAGSTQYCRH